MSRATTAQPSRDGVLGGRDEGLERQCRHAVLETGDLPLLRYVRAVRPESRDDAAVVP